MQRHQGEPIPCSLCHCHLLIDQEHGNILGAQPQTSQPDQPQLPNQAQVVNGPQLVYQATQSSPYVYELLPLTAPVSVLVINTQMLQNAEPFQTECLPYCSCTQPMTVTVQPAEPNRVVDLVRTDEQGQARDESSGPEPPAQSREEAREEPMEVHCQGDDEQPPENSDEHLSDAECVRNVESELNVCLWDGILSTDEELPEEGNRTDTPEAEARGADVLASEVTAAPPAPESNRNCSDDDGEATDRLCQEILDEIALILNEAAKTPATETGGEALSSRERAEEQATVYRAPVFRDVPEVGREIIDWLLTNIPQEVKTVEFDPASGSLVLPTDHAELVPPTSDERPTSFSTPISQTRDSPKYHEPCLTPENSDQSSGDLDASLETHLEDPPEESHLHQDVGEALPEQGQNLPSTPLGSPLQVFLNSEEHKETGFKPADCNSNLHNSEDDLTQSASKKREMSPVRRRLRLSSQIFEPGSEGADGETRSTKQENIQLTGNGHCEASSIEMPPLKDLDLGCQSTSSVPKDGKRSRKQCQKYQEYVAGLLKRREKKSRPNTRSRKTFRS